MKPILTIELSVEAQIILFRVNERLNNTRIKLESANEGMNSACEKACEAFDRLGDALGEIEAKEEEIFWDMFFRS